MKGIDFFNIKSGEQIWVKRPAQIKAMIESSDMSVNRQSDVGWRLGAEWVTRLRKARGDKALMAQLATKYGSSEVTDRDLLVAVYRQEAIAEKQRKSRSDHNPYEQEYLESIKPKQAKTKGKDDKDGGSKEE